MDWSKLLPAREWAREYGLESLRADVIAGTIVLFLTIPQVIAFAFLVGIPPQAALYAAVFALVCYAPFGSSRTLVVGPTAIIAMMTLEVASRYATPNTPEYLVVTIKLALMTGVLLIVLRLINFGAVISFLSHAVVTGFITAAALLIMLSQMPALLGLPSAPNTSIESLVPWLLSSINNANNTVIGISVAAVAILLFCKLWLERLLVKAGIGRVWRVALMRLAPMYVLVIATLVVFLFGFDEAKSVPVVGYVPSAMPDVQLILPTLDEMLLMFPSVLLLCMVIFLESTSVGAAVAAKRRETLDPNQELVGLGLANLGSSIAGGLPVAGSFARTVVNYSSGAVTPVAALVTAGLVVVSLLAFASLFFYLPQAALGAIIVLAATQLIDLNAIRKIFAFNPIDAITFAITFCAVLVAGVEVGILIGIAVSFVLLIRASSRPHIAVVGRWGDTENFRNVLRHEVTSSPKVLAVRIDESLYFVNTRFITAFLLNRVAESKEIKHVVLICTATNFIDSSGLEMLESLSENLAEVGVTLHLSEVKGPVMDKLKLTDFYEHMQGRVFFTTDIAMRELGGI